MKSDLSKMAVIILNYCSAKDTIKLATQLLDFKSNFKLIIVDNNSKDDSFEELNLVFKNNPLIDILETRENNGYSAGNNFGFRYAIERYNVNAVCVMNPDVEIPQLSVLEIMYQRLFSREKYGVIGGSAMGINGEYNPLASAWNIPSNRELIKNLYSGNKRTSKPVNYHVMTDNLALVDCVVGCFFIMKVELLLKMGYLDDSFFLYNEENVIGINCKKHGYQEVVALDQFYYHNHDFTKHRTKSFQKRISEAEICYKSRKHFCELYYSKLLKIPLFLVHVLNIAVVCISCATSKIRKRR